MSITYYNEGESDEGESGFQLSFIINFNFFQENKTLKLGLQKDNNMISLNIYHYP